MLEEIRFLARLPRLVAGMPLFSPIELLRMATINGAVALGLGAETGSIEPGKRADLVFLTLADLRLPPLPVAPEPRELAEYLTMYLTSRDITDVMIDGQLAVSGGSLATVTEEDLLGGFRGTLHKWYVSSPETEEKPVHPAAASAQPFSQAPVIPLVQPAEENLPEAEGFEEGFTVIGPRRGIPRREQTPKTDRPLPQKAPEEADRPPELPRDVRRTFGDDDEA
jgi:hypothetical protein